MNDLMTVKELAAHLKIGERTLRRYYKEKGLPFVMVGSQYRFRPDQVERWLEDQSREKGMVH